VKLSNNMVTSLIHILNAGEDQTPSATNATKWGHEVVICKSKNQQHGEEAQIVDQEEEDQLFMATCFSGIESSESWLIDNGCTNHMTHDKDLFRELRSSNTLKV